VSVDPPALKSDSVSLSGGACIDHRTPLSRRPQAPITALSSSLGLPSARPARPNAAPKRRLGAQLPAVAEAFRRLKAKGIGGAFVWALDNSCACGYKTEAALLAIAAEPPGTQGGTASHGHSSQHCCCVIA
jgi:hypothetical protein